MDSERITDLIAIFPNIEIEVIEDIYQQCQGDLDSTIAILASLTGSDAEVPFVEDDLSPEEIEKIRKNELEIHQAKLKDSKALDKDLTKALSLSMKEFEKEQKRLKKEQEKTKKGKKVDIEDKEAFELIHDKNPNEYPNNHINDKKKDEENMIDDDEYKFVEKKFIEPRPVQDEKKKMSFGEKFKNIFKKKSKNDKNNIEKLDIEIPDIKSNKEH